MYLLENDTKRGERGATLLIVMVVYVGGDNVWGGADSTQCFF
jgi:hypothetical protein